MRLSIDVDARDAIAALDRLGEVAEKYLLKAAEETANRIASEARRRVARRTGKTQAGIAVDTARVGSGYVVFVENADMPNLDLWLEFGTKYMTPKPFLFASARLEEGAHERRIIAAINDAIEEASR